MGSVAQCVGCPELDLDHVDWGRKSECVVGEVARRNDFAWGEAGVVTTVEKPEIVLNDSGAAKRGSVMGRNDVWAGHCISGKSR